MINYLQGVNFYLSCQLASIFASIVVLKGATSQVPEEVKDQEYKMTPPMTAPDKNGQ